MKQQMEITIHALVAANIAENYFLLVIRYYSKMHMLEIIPLDSL